MSDAYKCDRCEEYNEGDPPNTIKTRNSEDGVPKLGDGHVTQNTYELCERCGIIVEKVLKGELDVE